MSAIEFTGEEQELLVDLLEREAPNLREEIHYTDDHDYKEMLKKREASLRDLLKKLKGE